MNRVNAGALAGLLVGIVIGLIAMGMNMIGLCEICLIALGGGVFQQQLLQEPVAIGWILMGWVSHLIISIGLGIIFAFLLTYIGERLAVVKGAFFGAVVWYIAIGIFAPLAGYLPESPDPLELFIVFSYHLIFGMLVAYFIVKYGSTEVI
ncbi:hypothetical protein [Dethiobacter alkaliphilus]|uniref:hypothetical protein n=1 Tax=Dethiobacter alkaliphilus TaxID=427926 RepID=UPI002225DEA0|nr:hypothetical protein [Dethiobacter alkaliphilus]MCW3491669.1 hypothetical protein [Dethiobacter alkaliphilus]